MLKMLSIAAVFLFLGSLLFCRAASAEEFEKDVIQTSAGELTITFIGHGTLMFTFGGKVIHVDPYSRVADYSTLPKADVVLITHEHQDHLDEEALKHIVTNQTDIILNGNSAEILGKGRVLKNGESTKVLGISVEAVPAYNIVHMRDNGQPFHTKGEHNGYVLTFGDTRVYVAGDTENVPEMKELKDITIAFLPMNLPYTMTPEMVADAALSFQPKILYPYHYGQTDPEEIVNLLKDSGIEIRIRKMS
ncbi:MAG: MBL fold metallo-hydrolase [Candidatus Atribacteria bacterium]|nr:MBL fold metallo-hydrolase [Candidatus Atribacteria bacterium]